MKPVITIIFLAGILLYSGSSWSQQKSFPEIWSRPDAARSSVSVDTHHQRIDFRQRVKAGDDAATLALIREVDQNSNWPAPVRERLLFEFVNDLRNEAPRAVGNEVIEYLTAYQSLVLVPHDDHPGAGVPLFNIRGATAGVLNGWSRQEASFEGAAFLATQPANLVAAYQAEQSTPRRRGLLDSLETADQEQLWTVSRFALDKVEQEPELVAVAANAALMNKDMEVLEALAERGQGVAMPDLLRRSSETLDREQNARLFAAALNNPFAESRSLAIAQLSPVLDGHEPSETLLLKSLADPETGSSAALALSSSRSPYVIEQLGLLASGDESSLTTSRARLALRLQVMQLKQEMRP